MAKIKATDKVRVTKPGIFNGLEGEVVNAGSSFKISLGPGGTWVFKQGELELISKKQK